MTDVTILLKNSAIPGKTPTLLDLQTGEIAVNSADGKLFIKKDNGDDTAEIIVVGENRANYFVTELSNATPEISWNVNAAPVAKLILNSDKTLLEPTNFYSGRKYYFTVQQDSTGGWEFTPPVSFKFPGGINPVFSDDPDAIDVIECLSIGSVFLCQVYQNYLLDISEISDFSEDDFDIADFLAGESTALAPSGDFGTEDFASADF